MRERKRKGEEEEEGEDVRVRKKSKNRRESLEVITCDGETCKKREKQKRVWVA